MGAAKTGETMKIEIRNRWSGAVIYTHEAEGATMRDAVLAAVRHGAYLSGAYLSGADLTPIRDDIWAVLSSAPREVPAVIEALKAGRVDGSTYHGPCACLVGTIAIKREVSVDDIEGLRPNSSRPAERFFMGIRQGDTPETSQHSALALEWAQQWLDNMRAAFGPQAQ
jgi:hypothetical protein